MPPRLCQRAGCRRPFGNSQWECRWCHRIVCDRCSSLKKPDGTAWFSSCRIAGHKPRAEGVGARHGQIIAAERQAEDDA